jgi:hypothetical protein
LPKPNVNQKAMKKNSLIVTALLSSMLLAAQEPASGEDQVLKNKKGNEILPKKGDIALGFNTIPILDMFLGTLKLQHKQSNNW